MRETSGFQVFLIHCLPTCLEKQAITFENPAARKYETGVLSKTKSEGSTTSSFALQGRPLKVQRLAPTAVSLRLLVHRLGVQQQEEVQPGQEPRVAHHTHHQKVGRNSSHPPNVEHRLLQDIITNNASVKLWTSTVTKSARCLFVRCIVCTVLNHSCLRYTHAIYVPVYAPVDFDIDVNKELPEQHSNGFVILAIEDKIKDEMLVKGWKVSYLCYPNFVEKCECTLVGNENALYVRVPNNVYFYKKFGEQMDLKKIAKGLDSNRVRDEEAAFLNEVETKDDPDSMFDSDRMYVTYKISFPTPKKGFQLTNAVYSPDSRASHGIVKKFEVFHKFKDEFKGVGFSNMIGEVWWKVTYGRVRKLKPVTKEAVNSLADEFKEAIGLG